MILKIITAILLLPFTIFCQEYRSNQITSHIFIKYQDRIINGADAPSTAIAPYQVSLQQSGSHFCGGTVISTTHVMSAGHCKINASQRV